LDMKSVGEKNANLVSLENWESRCILLIRNSSDNVTCNVFLKGGPSIGTFLNFVVWQHQTSYRPEILTVY